jgi:hypothetical protein
LSNDWYSTAWSNGKQRILKSNQMDPDDPRFGVRRPGNPRVVIDGKGIASVSGKSPRLQVKGTWRNTETSVYVKQTDLRSITIHSRSFEEDGQESAYTSHFDEEGNVWIKKEAGNTYGPRVNHKTGFPVPKGKWIGLRQVIKDVPEGVSIESHMDYGDGWKKVTEGIDDGGWGKTGEPFRRNGSQCYVRTNDGKDTKYKDMSCREI